ncbi:MAG: hypothetical protein ACTSP3_00140 [Candidatus Heimdallarchaeaceae archaeon]
MKTIALINIGGNKGNPCRGPIFSDGSFRFLPIPEYAKVADEKTYPTYKSLGLSDYVPKELKDSFVHYDPHFPSLTYGHISRGFGYEKIIESLKPGDILAFYATLDYVENQQPDFDWIHLDWGTDIIGSYVIEQILNKSEFNNQEDFHKNPHYLRNEVGADLWIKGSSESTGLFDMKKES